MGSHVSREARPEIGVEQRNNRYSMEFKSYEEACTVDPDVRNFDNALQQRTGRFISALASGIKTDAVSLDSLREYTTCILDLDQDVVKILLEYKEDIWKNADLFELVEEYFENSLLTLDFCTQLESCLRKARDNQLILQIALQQLPREGNPSETQLQKILEELRNFREAESPFNEELLRHFTIVYERHIQMLDKLEAKKRKLDKKLKHVKAWRKLSNIIFGATFAAVVICSVVFSALVAPAAAGALTAAVPLAEAGKWALSYLKKMEDEIQKQLNIIQTMHIETFVVLRELEIIRRLVDRLSDTISSIITSVDFSLSHEDAIRMGMQEIKGQHENFVKEIEDLATYVSRCSEKTRKARTVVLLKIMRPDRKRSFSF